jgi:hypothetical protein
MLIKIIGDDVDDYQISIGQLPESVRYDILCA